MERTDDLQLKGLKLIQNPDTFCFGIDAVLLSDFAKAKKGDVVVDIGTGTGVIPILMSAKTNAEKFKAIEIQKDMADMARRSVILNEEAGVLEKGRIEIICADIKNAKDYIETSSVNVVTCNPPYMNGEGLKNENESIMLARHEISCDLNDVLSQGYGMLKSGGHYYMIHRPARLEDVLYSMRKNRLEPKRIRMVHPYVNKDANMVLIEAVKDAKSFMKVEAPLIVYEADGKYTEEIYRIYGR